MNKSDIFIIIFFLLFLLFCMASAVHSRSWQKPAVEEIYEELYAGEEDVFFYVPCGTTSGYVAGTQ